MQGFSNAKPQQIHDQPDARFPTANQKSPRTYLTFGENFRPLVEHLNIASYLIEQGA